MKRITLVVCIVSTFSAFSQAPDSKYITQDSLFSLKIKNEPRFYVNFHGGYSVALGSTFKFYPDDVSSIVLRMSDNDVVSKDVAYKAPKKRAWRRF